MGVRVKEALGSGDMHDGIIAVAEGGRVDVQFADSELVGELHHLLVDGRAVSVELPGTLLVPHGVAHCRQQHGCYVSCLH